MAIINFKSVGQKKEAILSEGAGAGFATPIGIKTPLELNTKDGLLKMHYKLEDQTADNLRNLLLTSWGERVGLYDFGANLRPLAAEYSSKEDFDDEAVARIKNAVTKWMPYVELIDFLSEVNRTENQITGVIKITVSYNIPSLYINQKKIEVVLYVI